MSLTDRPFIETFPKDIAASKYLTYMATIPHNPDAPVQRARDVVPK